MTASIHNLIAARDNRFYREQFDIWISLARAALDAVEFMHGTDMPQEDIEEFKKDSIHYSMMAAECLERVR